LLRHASNFLCRATINQVLLVGSGESMMLLSVVLYVVRVLINCSWCVRVYCINWPKRWNQDHARDELASLLRYPNT